MNESTTLRVYLDPAMLATAVAGQFNFMNVLKETVEGAGWTLEWHQTGPKAREAAPDLPGHALFHAEAPTHDRALSFRRAYHYPFWQIEPAQQRWRFHVARSTYDPSGVDATQAAKFVARLVERVLPGPEPGRGDYILVPLQGRIRRCRSFQTMSPVDMLTRVADTRRPTIATLHPGETYDAADHAALEALTRRFRNLTIGAKTAPLLRDCDFVATMNSAVAFDGLLLGKPAVLFGQSDFHHIALNAADLGAEEALDRARSHHRNFGSYIFWFLREMAINATAPDAQGQIIRAMQRGGWPIGQPPRL